MTLGGAPCYRGAVTADPQPPPPADWLDTLTIEQLLDLAERAAAAARRKLAEAKAPEPPA